MNPLLERLWGPSPGIAGSGHCTQHFSGHVAGPNKDMKISFKSQKNTAFGGASAAST